jgi:hypothetical protein
VNSALYVVTSLNASAVANTLTRIPRMRETKKI